jgi:hypothetical protein
VKSLHSEVQALQVADLLIGAVAFRLNRHSDADKANPDKVRLCEYILNRGGASKYIDGERGRFLPKEEGRFQIWPKRPAEARKNPPARKRQTVEKQEINVNSPVTLGDLLRDDKLLWGTAVTAATSATSTPRWCPYPPRRRYLPSAST